MPMLNYGLNILYARVSDISPLKDPLGPVNLKELTLRGTEVSDISPLKDLVNLEELDLGWCQMLSDISLLRNLKNLKKLTLDFTQVSDISPLSNLVYLTYLNLSRTNVSDISLLSNLENLKKTWSLALPNF